MSIPQSNYVSITSGVGGGDNVPSLNLGGLIVGNNPLIPTGTLLSFGSAAAVGEYFGTTSTAYTRAEFYFGWISKNITQPNQLSFWFWNGNQATQSLIFGAEAAYSAAAIALITNGDFTLTLGGYTHHLTSLNFGSDSTLAQVAATLQTAIQAVSAGGAPWTGATVTYDATNGRFDLVGGSYAADSGVSVVAGTTVDVAGAIGWLTGAIISNGSAAQTISASLNSLINLTNNFGSFCFTYENYQRAIVTASITTAGVMSVSAVTAGTLGVGNILTGTGVTAGTVISALGTGTGGDGTYTVSPAPSGSVTSEAITAAMPIQLTEYEQAATWNNSLTPNNQFMFLIPVSIANAASYAAALGTTGGCAAVILSPQVGAYSEMEPMMILAATQYIAPARNSVQNYMFQVFNDTASVNTGALQTTLDALLINYYGSTQQAGQVLSFFQRGVMFGIPTNPQDMGEYANEIWLKGALFTAIMTLLLSLAEVPANATGAAMLTATCQAIINQAQQNGTISQGRTLTTTEQLYVTQVTGSPTAYQQIQTIGYWFNVVIEPYIVDGITEYKAVYTLIYAANTVIRFVQGQDILLN